MHLGMDFTVFIVSWLGYLAAIGTIFLNLFQSISPNFAAPTKTI